jgi:hypothetical protein
MELNFISCNFLYLDVINASVAFNPLSFPIKRSFRNLKRVTLSIFSLLPLNFSREKFLNRKDSKIFSLPPENVTLNLQPGEWVEVRSIDKISLTLDKEGKYKDLYFKPEMEKFCGKNFKVFEKTEIIKLEETGEVRKLRSSSIFLEGVYCNGERYEGFYRACFHYLGEALLKRMFKNNDRP